MIQPSAIVVDGGIRSLGRFIGEKLEAAFATVRVLVQDYTDHPFSGIDVVAKTGAGSVEGKTNGNGTVVLKVPYTVSKDDLISVVAYLPEGAVTKQQRVSESFRDVITFRSVERAPRSILNTVEAIMGASGLAVFVAGRLVKTDIVSDILTMLGEIGVIGALFHRLGRGI